MSQYSIDIEDSEPFIFKVQDDLRNVNSEAYKPVIVSIGPYYHMRDPVLEEMQQHKQQYLDLLIERKRPEIRESYHLKLANLEPQARKCYADPMSKMNHKEFTEMMLLDSCFVVEFIRKMNYVHSDDPILDKERAAFENNDPIGKEQRMQDKIRRDMILLENQLPYVVLSTFYDMTTYHGEKSLKEMAMSCFNDLLPRPRLNSNDAFGNIGEIKHLLHLIHVFCRPFPEKTIKSNEDSNSGSAKNQGIEESSDDQIRCPLLPQNNDSGSDESYEIDQMGTVVELQEAGVMFKKVGKIYKGKLKEKTDNYVSLFDIDFKCGVMKVPCFKVEDDTETLLRNLIAYEQHLSNVLPQYFTDFASLMNRLINSKEDTKVLRSEGIILNRLGGGDEELSQLFKKLTDGICESDKPYDHELRRKVDKHCKSKFNTLVAKLGHDYFNNPWAGISTFAAVLLLLLTVGQFVIALYTLLA